MSAHTVLVNLETSAANGVIFENNTSSSVFVGAWSNGSSAGVSLGSGTPTISIDGATKSTRDTLHDALAVGSPKVVKITGVSVAGYSALSFFSFNGAFQYNGLCRGIIMMPDATYTANSAIFDAWIAGQ